MDKIGIYMIKNKVNGKIYIGQSIQLNKRWNEHIKALKANSVKCNPILLNEWNKYDEESFEFIVLEECGFDELTEKEKFYMEAYQSLDRNFGYNIREAGNQGTLPEYLKKQISEKVKLDRLMHPEKYSGENNGFYGKQHSEETIKKMSEIKKGKTYSLNTLIKKAKAKGNYIEIDIFKSIVSDMNNGCSKNEIASKYNISHKVVQSIKTGKHYMYELIKEEDKCKKSKKIRKAK